MTFDDVQPQARAVVAQPVHHVIEERLDPQ